MRREGGKEQEYMGKQDNPPLRSGIPECKMNGAADFAVNMVRVVGRKDRLRKEGNLRDFHHIILT
jgi:hypothetical protein